MPFSIARNWRVRGSDVRRLTTSERSRAGLRMGAPGFNARRSLRPNCKRRISIALGCMVQFLIAANLEGADMSAAQLQWVMFTNAGLVGASLAGANLNFAFLDGATLIGADFSNTQLQGVLLGATLFQLTSNLIPELSIARQKSHSELPGLFQEKALRNSTTKYRGISCTQLSRLHIRDTDFENVSPDFDLGRLAKFREATIACADSIWNNRA